LPPDGGFERTLLRDERGKVLRYTSTHSTPVGEKAFACISGTLELVVFFFETR
jgi:hypothetical protein